MEFNFFKLGLPDSIILEYILYLAIPIFLVIFYVVKKFFSKKNTIKQNTFINKGNMVGGNIIINNKDKK